MTKFSIQIVQLVTLLFLKLKSSHGFVARNHARGQLSAISLSLDHPTSWQSESAILMDALPIAIKSDKDTMPPLQEDTATWTQQQVLLGIGALCVSGGLLLVDSLPANAHDLMAHNPVTTIDTATVMIPSSAMTDTPTIDMASAATVVAPIDWSAIFQKASKKALGGGKAGASAAVVQVFSLMWLRTSMNYQYRYGGNLLSSLQTLWQEGGIPRLYQGLPFALVQGPLTRFGDTAANVGVLTLLENIPETQTLPLPIKTVLGSIAAGSWRIILMPIDASKTAMQVEGAEGLSNLWNLTVAEGPGPLYQGALASAAATAVGHFPWYTTYNYLNQLLPEIAKTEDLFLSLARSALIGFSASCVSDVCSNSLRVIKTTKQTARLSEKDKSGGDGDKNSPTREDISYAQVVKLIIETDGLKGLFGRGLQTRLLTNSVQGAVFSVLWKYFQQSNGSA